MIINNIENIAFWALKRNFHLTDQLHGNTVLHQRAHVMNGSDISKLCSVKEPDDICLVYDITMKLCMIYA